MGDWRFTGTMGVSGWPWWRGNYWRSFSNNMRTSLSKQHFHSLISALLLMQMLCKVWSRTSYTPFMGGQLIFSQRKRCFSQWHGVLCFQQKILILSLVEQVVRKAVFMSGLVFCLICCLSYSEEGRGQARKSGPWGVHPPTKAVCLY